MVLLIFSVNIHGLFFWKIKKGITITSVFQKWLDESSCKPNKMWVDKGKEFYNRSIISWLEKHAIEMYSTHEMYSIHNEGKSVLSERFIIILKNKIYK